MSIRCSMRSPLRLRMLPSLAVDISGTVSEESVRLVSDGLYFNEKFSAHNVWELEIDPKLIDEAAAIFHDGSSFATISQPSTEPYEEISTKNGGFFAQHVSWNSNVAWVSADDEPCFDVFEVCPFFPGFESAPEPSPLI